MAVVSIAEAKNHLPRLVQQVEAGEPVRITRRGLPVAVLISEAEYARDQVHAFGPDKRMPGSKGSMSVVVEPASR